MSETITLFRVSSWSCEFRKGRGKVRCLDVWKPRPVSGPIPPECDVKVYVSPKGRVTVYVRKGGEFRRVR